MTTATQSLSDWLLAQIADDEAAAQAAGAVTTIYGTALDFSWRTYDPESSGLLTTTPARVLAQCEALRAVVALHDGLLERELRNRDQSAMGADLMWRDTLRALALPFADQRRLAGGVAVSEATETLTRWRDVPAPFGQQHPFGCCTAIVRATVCGWPLRSDGTCGGGHHPARPGWVPPYDESDGAGA